MSLNSAALVVVTGLPCTGKSTLAVELRQHTGWPVLAKDVLKETLFATLGMRDRAWSKQLSMASYALMFAVAEELLASGQALVMEGNFRAVDHGDSFTRLLARQPVGIVQVFCNASTDVVKQRLRDRAQASLRHPGHLDKESHAELEAELESGSFRPLALDGPVIEWDSSQPDARRLAGLLDFVTDAVSDCRPRRHRSGPSTGE